MVVLIRGAEGAYKLAMTCKIIAYIAHVWHFGAVFRRFYMGNVVLKLPSPCHGAFTLSPYAQRLVKAKHRFN
jgi:hypothetical protein